MALIKTAELKKSSKEDLAAKKLELQKELMKLEAQKITGAIANTGKIKTIKRAIATINTLQSKL